MEFILRNTATIGGSHEASARPEYLRVCNCDFFCFENDRKMFDDIRTRKYQTRIGSASIDSELPARCCAAIQRRSVLTKKRQAGRVIVELVAGAVRSWLGRKPITHWPLKKRTRRIGLRNIQFRQSDKGRHIGIRKLLLQRVAATVVITFEDGAIRNAFHDRKD